MKPDTNGNISLDALKGFVLNSCKDAMVNKQLAKRDIEGFLSAFIYNAYGTTDAKQVVPLIFTDENYVSKKLNNRVRANPPPDDINGDLDLYEVSDTQIHSTNVKKVMQDIENKVFRGHLRLH
jgi:hypothetical protein